MNILIVGLGSIAKKHLAVLHSLAPDAKIYALRSKESADKYQDVINIYNLNYPRGFFDFAIVSNPTSHHARTIEDLLEMGMPLFIEKPIFSNVNQEALIERIKQADILTYVACNLRFLDSLQYLKSYITEHPERRVNEVNVYCGSYLPEWRPGTDYKQCYSARPELGGGVNIDLIHDIDYVYWIFGTPQKTLGVCRSVSTLEIESFDYANYLMFYPTFTASITLNYYRRDYKRTLEVVFEDQTWLLNLKTNQIIDSNGNIVYKGQNTPLETYYNQMAYFLNLLKTNQKAENDAQEAYKVLQICLNYERP